MKITHKDFLAEQAKLGKKVPQIFNTTKIIEAQVNPKSTTFGGTANISLMFESNLGQIQVWINGGNAFTITGFNSEVLKKLENSDNKINLIKNSIMKIVTDALNEKIENVFEEISAIPDEIEEGFFGDLKNKVMGTVEYNTGNNYSGSPEAQKFVTSDRRSKVQIETLTKKGMTPEEAKSAVMYVFDKSGKNPLGFMGKTTEYNPQTKTLKVTTGGMNNPSLMA